MSWVLFLLMAGAVLYMVGLSWALLGILGLAGAWALVYVVITGGPSRS